MKYDKDVAVLGALAISFIVENYGADIPDDLFLELQEAMKSCDYVLEDYPVKGADILLAKDAIKAIQNLQITSEEYNALERGE